MPRRLAPVTLSLHDRDLLARDRVLLAEPRAEVDELAALAAERSPW
jgi:hypothetical protein